MGYVAGLRAKVGSQKVFLAGTAVVVRDDRGRVLLHRRADFDTWAIPGGTLEFGERLVDCAWREFAEETGLGVIGLNLFGVYSEPELDVTYPNGDQAQQFIVAFTGNVQAIGDLAHDHETTAIDWFPIDDLPQLPVWQGSMLDDAADPGVSWKGPIRATTTVDQIRDIRSVIGSAPYIGVGATGVVRDSAGRILMIRRSDDGSWGFPGGFLDLGENASAAVVREALEETGLAVQPTRLLGVHAEPEAWVYPNGDRTQSVVAIFECATTGDAEPVAGDEASSVEWIDPSDGRVASLSPPIRKLFDAVESGLEGFVIP